MDEFRHPKEVQKAKDAAKQAARDVEIAELHKAVAVTTAQMEELKAAHDAEEEAKRIIVARTPAILAHQRCLRRQIATVQDNDRMQRWKIDLIKTKLRALVEVGMDEGMDVREEEPNGVGSVRWWMEMARNENIQDGGNGNLLGNSIKTRKMLDTGVLVEWNDEELEAAMDRL